MLSSLQLFSHSHYRNAKKKTLLMDILVNNRLFASQKNDWKNNFLSSSYDNDYGAMMAIASDKSSLFITLDGCIEMYFLRNILWVSSSSCRCIMFHYFWSLAFSRHSYTYSLFLFCKFSCLCLQHIYTTGLGKLLMSHKFSASFSLTQTFSFYFLLLFHPFTYVLMCCLKAQFTSTLLHDSMTWHVTWCVRGVSQ